MEAVLETMDVREIRERNHLQGMQEVANGVEMLETMDVREIWGRDRLQEMQEGVNGLEMLGTMDVREMVLRLSTPNIISTDLVVFLLFFILSD